MNSNFRKVFCSFAQLAIMVFSRAFYSAGKSELENAFESVAMFSP